MDSTTICNLALAKIGDLSIMSLDDPTPEARFSNLFYIPTKNELLRLHNWNWATSHSRLSAISPDPLYDWLYAFALPVDFGRMLIFNSFSPATPMLPYQIVGNQIYTDESEAVISYIQNITDENRFDPLFVDALVYRLASKLARPLAGSLDIEKINNSYFEKALAEARRIDAGEGIPRRKMQWIDSDLVRSRYTGVV
jgi:hypothetical protein